MFCTRVRKVENSTESQTHVELDVDGVNLSTVKDFAENGIREWALRGRSHVVLLVGSRLEVLAQLLNESNIASTAAALDIEVDTEKVILATSKRRKVW